MDVPLNVLVVDDEKVLAWALKDSCEEMGCVVQVAHTFEDGVGFLDKSPWDVLITDINLADQEEGIELLDLAKRKYPEIEVIITTAQSDFNLAKKAIRKHVHSFINKPYDLEEIHTAVQDIQKKSNVYKKIKFLEKENSDLRAKANERDGMIQYISQVNLRRQEQAQARMMISSQDHKNLMYHCERLDKGRYGFFAMSSKTKGIQKGFHEHLVWNMCREYVRDGLAPSPILTKMNDVLLKNGMDVSAMFIFTWDPLKNKITYANAGWDFVIGIGKNDLLDFPVTSGLIGLTESMNFVEKELGFSLLEGLVMTKEPMGGSDKNAYLKKCQLVLSKTENSSRQNVRDVSHVLEGDYECLFLQLDSKETTHNLDLNFVNPEENIKNLQEYLQLISEDESVGSEEDIYLIKTVCVEAYLFLLDRCSKDSSVTLVWSSGTKHRTCVFECRNFCISESESIEHPARPLWDQLADRWQIENRKNNASRMTFVWSRRVHV